MRINFRWTVHDARMFGWIGEDGGKGVAVGDSTKEVRKEISRQVPYGCVSAVYATDNTPEDTQAFFNQPNAAPSEGEKSGS